MMPKSPYLLMTLYFFVSGWTTNAAVERLQSQLDVASAWFNDRKITINASKTCAFLFANKTPFHTNKIKIEHEFINWSTQAKYLGVTINKNLWFSNHIKQVVHKANAAKHSLFPVINNLSPVPISTKSVSIKCTSDRFLRMHLRYGHPIYQKPAGHFSNAYSQTF